MTGIEYTTERMDHLGIVAGICRQINLTRIIDESISIPTGRRVSCGQAVQAMVLNALGLTGRALYLMPEYMRNKPVDLLTTPYVFDEEQAIAMAEAGADLPPHCCCHRVAKSKRQTGRPS